MTPSLPPLLSLECEVRRQGATNRLLESLVVAGPDSDEVGESNGVENAASGSGRAFAPERSGGDPVLSWSSSRSGCSSLITGSLSSVNCRNPSISRATALSDFVTCGLMTFSILPTTASAVASPEASKSNAIPSVLQGRLGGP